MGSKTLENFRDKLIGCHAIMVVMVILFVYAFVDHDNVFNMLMAAASLIALYRVGYYSGAGLAYKRYAQHMAKLRDMVEKGKDEK